MEEKDDIKLEISLLKERIIYTNDIFKLGHNKDKAIRILEKRLKKLGNKFALVNKDYTLLYEKYHNQLELCNGNHLLIEKDLAQTNESYALLEQKHNEFVNTSGIKFQTACNELVEAKKKCDVLTKKIEKLEKKEIKSPRSNQKIPKLEKELEEKAEKLSEFQEKLKNLEKLRNCDLKRLAELQIECNHLKSKFDLTSNKKSPKSSKILQNKINNLEMELKQKTDELEIIKLSQDTTIREINKKFEKEKKSLLEDMSKKIISNELDLNLFRDTSKKKIFNSVETQTELQDDCDISDINDIINEMKDLPNLLSPCFSASNDSFSVKDKISVACGPDIIIPQFSTSSTQMSTENFQENIFKNKSFKQNTENKNKSTNYDENTNSGSDSYKHNSVPIKNTSKTKSKKKVKRQIKNVFGPNSPLNPIFPRYMWPCDSILKNEVNESEFMTAYPPCFIQYPNNICPNWPEMFFSHPNPVYNPCHNMYNISLWNNYVNSVQQKFNGLIETKCYKHTKCKMPHNRMCRSSCCKSSCRTTKNVNSCYLSRNSNTSNNSNENNFGKPSTSEDTNDTIIKNLNIKKQKKSKKLFKNIEKECSNEDSKNTSNSYMYDASHSEDSSEDNNESKVRSKCKNTFVKSKKSNKQNEVYSSNLINSKRRKQMIGHKIIDESSDEEYVIPEWWKRTSEQETSRNLSENITIDSESTDCSRMSSPVMKYSPNEDFKGFTNFDILKSESTRKKIFSKLNPFSDTKFITNILSRSRKSKQNTANTKTICDSDMLNLSKLNNCTSSNYENQIDNFTEDKKAKYHIFKNSIEINTHTSNLIQPESSMNGDPVSFSPLMPRSFVTSTDTDVEHIKSNDESETTVDHELIFGKRNSTSSFSFCESDNGEFITKSKRDPRKVKKVENNRKSKTNTSPNKKIPEKKYYTRSSDISFCESDDDKINHSTPLPNSVKNFSNKKTQKPIQHMSSLKSEVCSKISKDFVDYCSIINPSALLQNDTILKENIFSENKTKITLNNSEKNVHKISKFSQNLDIEISAKNINRDNECEKNSYDSLKEINNKVLEKTKDICQQTNEKITKKIVHTESLEKNDNLKTIQILNNSNDNINTKNKCEANNITNCDMLEKTDISNNLENINQSSKFNHTESLKQDKKSHFALINNKTENFSLKNKLTNNSATITEEIQNININNIQYSLSSNNIQLAPVDLKNVIDAKDQNSSNKIFNIKDRNTDSCTSLQNEMSLFVNKTIENAENNTELKENFVQEDTNNTKQYISNISDKSINDSENIKNNDENNDEQNIIYDNNLGTDNTTSDDCKKIRTRRNYKNIKPKKLTLSKMSLRKRKCNSVKGFNIITKRIKNKKNVITKRIVKKNMKTNLINAIVCKRKESTFEEVYIEKEYNNTNPKNSKIENNENRQTEYQIFKSSMKNPLDLNKMPNKDETNLNSKQLSKKMNNLKEKDPTNVETKIITKNGTDQIQNTAIISPFLQLNSTLSTEIESNLSNSTNLKQKSAKSTILNCNHNNRLKSDQIIDPVKLDTNTQSKQTLEGMSLNSSNIIKLNVDKTNNSNKFLNHSLSGNKNDNEPIDIIPKVPVQNSRKSLQVLSKSASINRTRRKYLTRSTVSVNDEKKQTPEKKSKVETLLIKTLEKSPIINNSVSLNDTVIILRNGKKLYDLKNNDEKTKDHTFTNEGNISSDEVLVNSKSCIIEKALTKVVSHQKPVKKLESILHDALIPKTRRNKVCKNIMNNNNKSNINNVENNEPENQELKHQFSKDSFSSESELEENGRFILQNAIQNQEILHNEIEEQNISCKNVNVTVPIDTKQNETDTELKSMVKRKNTVVNNKRLLKKVKLEKTLFGSDDDTEHESMTKFKTEFTNSPKILHDTGININTNSESDILKKTCPPANCDIITYYKRKNRIAHCKKKLKTETDTKKLSDSDSCDEEVQKVFVDRMVSLAKKCERDASNSIITNKKDNIGNNSVSSENNVVNKCFTSEENTKIENTTQANQLINKNQKKYESNIVFKRPEKSKFKIIPSTPKSPDFLQYDPTFEPKIIPGEPIIQIEAKSVEASPQPNTEKIVNLKTKTIAKYITDITEHDLTYEIIEDVLACVVGQDPFKIARAIVQEAIKNVYLKLDTTYTPLAPVLNKVHQKIIIFLDKLAIETNYENIHEFVLNETHQKLLREKRILYVQCLTRFYVGVSMQRYDAEKIRMLCVDAAYYMNDYFAPVFFIVLTMYPEVLPNAEDLKRKIPLNACVPKALIQIIKMKQFKKPGFNLTNLNFLLTQVYGYEMIRANNDTLIDEFVKLYLGTGSKIAFVAITTLCKNLPNVWTFNKITKYFIPLVNKNVNNSDNANFIALTINLITRLMQPLCYKSRDSEKVTQIRNWFSIFMQNEDLLPTCIKDAITDGLKWLVNKAVKTNKLQKASKLVQKKKKVVKKVKKKGKTRKAKTKKVSLTSESL